MEELTYHVRKMRALLEMGKSFEDCRRTMGLTSEEFDRVRKVCCEEQAKRMRQKSKEEIYAEYVVEQRKCLTALEKIIERVPKDGKKLSDNALLSAIKAKSEIEDKIIEKGQELGILEKNGKTRSSAPSPVQVEDSQVGKMRDDDLRDAVASEAVVLERVTNQFQGKKFAELDPPKIYKKANKPIDFEKHHKANTARVQGGRAGFLRYAPERGDE